MNTNNTDKDDDKPDEPVAADKRLAMLGLLLDKPGAAQGDKPSTEELWDWMHGSVPEPRASQIQSHVASDSEIYQQWHEMRISKQEFELNPTAESTEQAVVGSSSTAIEDSSGAAPSGTAQSVGTQLFSKLVSWLKPNPYTGMALAAILGGVITINLVTSEPPVDVWSDWQSPKSISTDEPLPDQQELQAVLAGAASRLAKLSVPAYGPNGRKLPRKIPQCVSASDDAKCEPRRQALFELGELAIRSRVLCLTSIDIPEEIMTDIQAIKKVIDDNAMAGRFADPVDQWINAKDKSTQCGAINQVIARALSGLSA